MEDSNEGHLLGYTCKIPIRLTSFVWVTAARLLSGTSVGIAQLAVTVHASDIASKRMRQVISYAITAVIALSALFYAFLVNAWYGTTYEYPEATQFGMGHSVVAVALLAMLLSPILTNESSPYYLLRGNEAKARRRFAKLKSDRKRKPRAKTLCQFDEIKTMVDEDLHSGRGLFSGANLRSLRIVLNVRMLHVAMSSVPLLMLLMKEVKMWRNGVWPSIDDGYLIESIAAKILFGSVVMAIARWCGRHKFIYLGLTFTSGFFLGAFLQNTHLSWPARQTLCSILCYSVPVAHSLFAFGVDYYQLKQSVDAFSVTNKAWSLAIVASIEHLTHAALITLVFHHQEELKVLTAGAIILMSFTAVAIVPDTRKLSLRATRNVFGGLMPSRKST